MVLGTLRVTLHIPHSHSLKEKRMVVRSLVDRLRRQFNVAVAEIDDQDVWQVATLGAVVISADSRHADEMVRKVLDVIEAQEGDALITQSHVELVHV
ncbi:MAG TPA: DUF503 domain-containing protein [Candidatus Dormibacteraeota bacterium]